MHRIPTGPRETRAGCWGALWLPGCRDPMPPPMHQTQGAPCSLETVLRCSSQAEQGSAVVDRVNISSSFLLAFLQNEIIETLRLLLETKIEVGGGHLAGAVG